MSEYFKENWSYYLLATVVGATIANVVGFEYWFRALSLTVPLCWFLCAFFIKKNEPDLESQEIIKSLDLMISEQSIKMEEQEKVLEEYEKIFDAQLVELPCICGGNTFQGLFSPNTENIVQCEKCKEHYKVDINYNSVLISEPLNVEQTFNELVGEVPVN